MKTSIVILLLSSLSSLGFAQNRSERYPLVVMQPGESYLVMHPETRELMQIACAGKYPTPPLPGQTPSIEYYGQDNCSGELVAMSSTDRDCSTFPRGSVWGIRIHGQCHDIEDTTAVLACSRFKSIAEPSAVSIYKSDNCSGALLAAVSKRTDCKSLGNGSAWAIKKDGRCIDIKDTTLTIACEQFR